MRLFVSKGVLTATLAFVYGVASFCYAQDQAPNETQAPNEIERMKAKYEVANSIADLTPTVCTAAGVGVPTTATANKIDAVLTPMNEAFEGRPAKRVFVYCADCIGDVLLKNHAEDFADALKEADAVIRSSNVMATCTPVCYATIFCGAGPELHGINTYRKPVVKEETLFDSFLASGKKIAILAQEGSTVDTIFRERNIDYYHYPTDAEAVDKALELVRNSDYDLIVLHDCEYDTAMHQFGTEAQEAVDARRTVLKRWGDIAKATDEAWSGFDRLNVFAADHGSHMPEGATSGTHGADVYEDAVVNHFYRWRVANSK